MKTRKTLIDFINPPGMEVYNAPRPLPGVITWTGDFVAGCFYAAIDPQAEDYKWLLSRIEDLDGTRLIKVTEKEIIQEMTLYYQENYPDLDFDPEDPNTQEKMIRGWFNADKNSN